MFRTILVPVDSSPLAEHALPFALSIARRSDAALHLALVHVPESYHEYAHLEGLDSEVEAREDVYLSSLSRRLAESFPGKVQLHHLEGIVPETLTATVDELKVDLVVMNAHGWGYLSRAIIGSVSDYLMRHLTVPLLLMHRSDDAMDLFGEKTFRRILICLDGSPEAESILRPARELGDCFQSDYRLLRVVVSPRHLLDSPHDAPPQAEHTLSKAILLEAAEYLRGVARSMQSTTNRIETRVVAAGNVATTILAEAVDCDLIAISTHGRGGLKRLMLGSVADKVIRTAHTPVLVYKATEID